MFSDDDLTDVLNSIEKDNQRALNGDVKVLIAVRSYRKRKFEGKEVC